jgi:hypothetical protein
VGRLVVIVSGGECLLTSSPQVAHNDDPSRPTKVLLHCPRDWRRLKEVGTLGKLCEINALRFNIPETADGRRQLDALSNDESGP